jgi:ATP-binding cassette subfamily B protein|tara:strand:- start:1968 stop:3863 length:1896 start_codon:yes stop_codon:yes gene_type:complete
MSVDTYDDDIFEDGIDEESFSDSVKLHLWRKLFSFTGPYRREVWLLIASGIATAVFEAAFPLITREVIDDVAVSGMDTNLWYYGGLYLVVVLLLGASTWGFIYMAGKIRTHVGHDIRRAGFANLQRLSFSYYDHRPVGWLIARMTSDCERLTDILAWGILDFFWCTFIMIAIAAAMLIMNPLLGALVLLVVPLLWWVSKYFQKVILKSARQVRRTNSQLTGSYNESIMGVRTTKAFVRETHNHEDFRKQTDKMYRYSVQNALQNAVYLPLVMTIGSLATGLALVVGGVNMISGIMTTGTLIAFINYSRQFFEPVQVLAMWLAEMQMAQASAERVISLVEAEPEIEDSASVRQAIQHQDAQADHREFAVDGMAQRISEIELKDVHFAYSPEEPVLEGIDLTVKQGQTIAIVGPTGGGKSTLVNVICRFYEPTSGSVSLNGLDYRQRSLHWLQSNLGMVLQTSHVFSGSIADNIRYGDLDASAESIEQAARISGAHDLIIDKEDGYDTALGEGGHQLSEGEKQLVSFARAILADPQILIMDEATSSVDSITEARIQQGLGHVLEGRIAFVIAHRLSTIRAADRILVIDDGRIVEQGSHEELLKLQGHYYDLYRRQKVSTTTDKASGWMATADV